MPTLAEVARVKIEPSEIRRELSSSRKRELRREAIKAYIRSKPYGKRIKGAEFQNIGNFSTYANADNFIKKMIRDDEIVRHNIGPKSFFYTVIGETKVTKPASEDFVKGKQHTIDELKELEERRKADAAGKSLIPEHLRAEAAKANRGPSAEVIEKAIDLGEAIADKKAKPAEQPAPPKPSQNSMRAPMPAMYSMAHLETLAMRHEFYEGRRATVSEFLKWVQEQNHGL